MRRERFVGRLGEGTRGLTTDAKLTVGLKHDTRNAYERRCQGSPVRNGVSTSMPPRSVTVAVSGMTKARSIARAVYRGGIVMYGRMTDSLLWDGGGWRSGAMWLKVESRRV